MTAHPPEELVSRLRELLARATPDPLTASAWGALDPEDKVLLKVYGPLENREALAALIVAAVNALPALLDGPARERALKKCIEGFIRTNDEAPEFGMCDCIDNGGEHYQSADLGGLLIHARMLVWGDHATPEAHSSRR